MTPLRNANAERQARHRARVKEKLRNAADARPLRNDLQIREEMAERISARLHRAYFGAADVFREQLGGPHVDELIEGAIEEFEHESVSFDDIIKIVEMAGYARLGEFFALHCNQSDRDAEPPEWVRHHAAIQKRGVT